MMESSHLEFYKHLMCCWGLPDKTVGVWRGSRVDFSWGSIKQTIDIIVDTTYDSKYRPTEWLYLERYFMSLNYK